MKIDFSAILTDLDDDPLMIAKKGANTLLEGGMLSADAKQNEPMTLARAARIALGAPYRQQQPATAEEQFDDIALALRIGKGGIVEVSETEIARIKTRAAGTFSTPVVTARIVELLKIAASEPEARKA